MRKLIAAILILVMGLGMAACKKNDINVKELQKINGNMLEIHTTPQGPMTEEDLEIYSTTITVKYSGEIVFPFNDGNLDPKMKDEDYQTIYGICYDAVKTDKFRDYSEEVDDGTTYSFTFYDENGAAHNFYSGYIYNNKELSKILDIIGNYSID